MGAPSGSPAFVLPATNKLAGKMRFATAAEIVAAAAGVVADASQVVLLTTGAGGIKGITLGAAQTAAGQVAQLTTPYTAAGLNTKQAPFRVQVGALNPNGEFDSQPGANSCSTAAVTGAVYIPAGQSNSQTYWPDSGVAGICTTGNAGKSAVGGLFLGGTAVPGAVVEAVNGVVGNAPTGLLACDGNGLDFYSINGMESDNNLFKKPPTATTTAAAASSASTTLLVASAAGIVVGNSVTGPGVTVTPLSTYVTGINGTTLSLNQPATVAAGATLVFGTAPVGNLYGVTAYIGGTTNLAYGVGRAFDAVSQGPLINGTPLPQWPVAYNCAAGMAGQFANIGALYNLQAGVAGAGSPSQPIYWNAVTTAGTPIQDILAMGADGTFNIAFGAGANPVLNVGGSLKLAGGLGLFGTAAPASKPTISGAKGGNAALASLIAALVSYGLVTDGTSA